MWYVKIKTKVEHEHFVIIVQFTLAILESANLSRKKHSTYMLVHVHSLKIGHM